MRESCFKGWWFKSH